MCRVVCGGGRLEFGRWTSIMDGSRFGMVDISGLEMILSPRGNVALLLPRHIDTRLVILDVSILPPSLVHPDPLATYNLPNTTFSLLLNAKILFTASVFPNKAKHTLQNSNPSPPPLPLSSPTAYCFNFGAFGSSMHWSTRISVLPVAFARRINSGSSSTVELYR